MRTKLERKDVAGIVLEVIQGWHFDTRITEDTDFIVDIPIDNRAKGLYYYALKIHLEKLGYPLSDFSVQDCENAETIKDMIDAVWDDFDSNSKRIV